MEVKFDVIKPNLYLAGDEIYFGIDSSDIIPVSKSIEEIVRNNIGELKVKESDLEVAEFGKSKKTEEKYIAPLRKYLDTCSPKYSLGRIPGVATQDSLLFGLGYIINAQTAENRSEIDDWKRLQAELADPDKYFNGLEESSFILKVDREKTLEQMKKVHEELDLKMPENYAEFVLVSGYIPSTNTEVKRQHLGVIAFEQLKAKDKNKIEGAKTGLIERLKETDGPCLSFDAPCIFGQMMDLFYDAPELIQRYGDVLASPNWKTRLFRLDP
ncbi:MAG: hypothetical protein AABW50_02805 [Nanoarchaeota archaeon]